MWIASKYGFFSIVQKDGHFHVRARLRKDLELLFEHVQIPIPKIEVWPEADYRYRVRLPEGSRNIQAVFSALCSSIDYTNFKSEIAATPSQRGRLHAYHEIWHLMAEHQH